MRDQLSLQAEQAIGEANFRLLWPIWVRQELVRAAKHEGPIPDFAVPRVQRALRKAADAERHHDRQVEQHKDYADRRYRAVARV